MEDILAIGTGLGPGQGFSLTVQPEGDLYPGQGAAVGARHPAADPARGNVVGGVVMDAAGYPVAGRTLVLDREGVGTIATTVADAQGFYRFTGLGPGLRCRVRLLPTADQSLTAATAAGAWTTVSMSEGATVSTVTAGWPEAARVRDCRPGAQRRQPRATAASACGFPHALTLPAQGYFSSSSSVG